MHTLIVGNHRVPRAAFVDRLLRELHPCPPLYGYRTVKEPAPVGEREPIYLYPAAGERRRSKENLLGWCRNQQSEAYPEVFEQWAFLIEEARPDGLLLLDEIGPMESRSPRFSAAVLRALAGDVPVLAVVRDKDTPFLKRVRNHPQARAFVLTEENEEDLFPRVLDFLRRQLAAKDLVPSAEAETVEDVPCFCQNSNDESEKKF